MKDINAIRERIQSHMRSHMYDAVPVWPITITVGLPKQAQLEANAIAVHDNNNAIRRWARSHGCDTVLERRRIVTPVELVSKVIVPNESAALRVVGRNIASEYREARQRIAAVLADFDVDATSAASMVAMTRREQNLDFGLLLEATRYFRDHEAVGMLPRRVPLTGFSSKWLNEPKANRRKAICLLLGKETLGLARRPVEFRFRYLDPAYGDIELERIAWCPWEGDELIGVKYAVIVENKDTYQAMPPIADGICIWGSGRVASEAIRGIPVLCDLHIIYWGDMDADGLEILSALRESGLECDSIFMDYAAYECYSRYGTNLTERSTPIALRRPRPVPGLRPHEKELYMKLCADAELPYRRVEQERIPLDDAVQALSRLGIPAEFIVR